MKVKNEDVLECTIDDLKEFDLMRNPEIRNIVLEAVEEWKACRDSLCPDSGLKCNTCDVHDECDKKIYIKLHPNIEHPCPICEKICTGAINQICDECEVFIDETQG